jgi:hypothetical protein
MWKTNQTKRKNVMKRKNLHATYIDCRNDHYNDYHIDDIL